MNQSTLSNNGYKIKKKSLNLSQIKDIKKDLTVNPFVYGDLVIKMKKNFNYF